MNSQSIILQNQVESIASHHAYFTELDLQDLHPSTVAKYKQCINSYISWLDERPVNIDTAKQFLAFLRQKGYSQQSIKHYYVAIRPFLAFLGIELKLKLRKQRRLPPYHSAAEVKAIFDATLNRTDNYAGKNQERDQLIILTLAYTGLRRAELLDLRVSDINFRSQLLYVRAGKGDKDRAIPLLPELSKRLASYINHHHLRPSDSVFSLSKRRLYDIINFCTKAAGVSNFSPHSFRHFFATQLVEQGVDIRSIQQLLGHSDIASTAVYLDLCPHHLQAAVKKLPSLSSAAAKSQQLSLTNQPKRRTMQKNKPKSPPNNPLFTYDDNDDGTNPSSSSSHQSSSSAPEFPEIDFESDVDQLIDELGEVGFDAATAFVMRYGTERVRQALDLAKSKEDQLTNMPGYIRMLVTSRGKIPKPQKPKEPKGERDPDRYIKGKYGHLVQR